MGSKNRPRRELFDIEGHAFFVTFSCYRRLSLLGRDRWSLVRRYVWLPGWLLWLAVGSAWALAVCRRYPDVVDLWFSDYAGRDGIFGALEDEGRGFEPVEVVSVVGQEGDVREVFRDFGVGPTKAVRQL